MLGADPGALTPIANVAHVIQTALTPVFFLSGIGALLNVFSNRLARVADQSHRMAEQLPRALPADRAMLERELAALQTRSFALDTAVVLATAAGGAVCVAALLLFLGTLRDQTIAGLLYGSFGLALVSTMGALTAFLVEMLMASQAVRRHAEARQAAGAHIAP